MSDWFIHTLQIVNQFSWMYFNEPVSKLTIVMSYGYSNFDKFSVVYMLKLLPIVIYWLESSLFCLLIVIHSWDGIFLLYTSTLSLTYFLSPSFSSCRWWIEGFLTWIETWSVSHLMQTEVIYRLVDTEGFVLSKPVGRFVFLSKGLAAISIESHKVKNKAIKLFE